MPTDSLPATTTDTKPSGVPWLGDIPASWEVKRLKFIARVVGGSTPDSDVPDFWDGDIVWVTPADLGKLGTNDIGESERMLTQAGYRACGTTMAPAGSVVLSTRAPIGHAAITSVDCCTNQGCKTIVPNREMSVEYLYRCIRTAKDYLKSLGTGTTFMELAASRLKDIELPVPPLDEQARIVAYLDRKCALIETFTRKKRELIARLKERKAAFIARAVTHGLDPNANTKPSGVAWLGDVPAHWEVKRLKFVLKEPLKYGANEEAAFDDVAHPRYLRITDFDAEGKLRADTFRSLPPDVAEPYLLSEGDVLFARSGATVGKTFQFKNYDGKACFAGYLIKATLNEKQMLSDFLYLYTKSGLFDTWKNSIFIQATIQNIGADKYSCLPVPVPPITEQRAIAAAIKAESELVDRAVSRIERELELIVEYRASLIAEAVRGGVACDAPTP